jgi:hydroxymethylbilane synthase
MKYKIGTRDSKLALIQTDLVCKELIKNNPNLRLEQFELVKIKTIGDKIQNKNLQEIGGKNLFIKEIEEALIDKKIDFAVHSLKDMTANLDSRLKIAACLKRENPCDAFVSLKYKNFNDLPIGSTIGTSSIRRKYIALNKRPDLNVIPFRGNVLTRLEKLRNNQVDATFLAVSGLKRLNIDQKLYRQIEIQDFLPSISQGVIGVECRLEDKDLLQLLSSINDTETEICTIAERAYLEYMEADCTVPIAAYATLEENQIFLKTLVIDKDYNFHKFNINGNISEAHDMGIKAGRMLKTHL